MSRMKTTEQFKKEIYAIRSDLEILNEYTGCKTENRIECRCKICGYEWDTAPASLRNGSGCPECGRRKTKYGRLITHDEFVSKLNSVQPNLEVVGKYTGSHKLLECKCKIHNYTWSSYPANLLNNSSHCPKCTEDKAQQHVAARHDEFLEKLKSTRNDVEVLERYSGFHTKLKCICLKHKNEFMASPRMLLSKKTSCPLCKLEDSLSSKGERSISKYLRFHNIEYTFQHIFADCKYQLPLKFDFYIPELNTCIEYDGEQHFNPVCFDGKSDDVAKSEYEKCVIRDGIKDAYCAQNDIRLIRIPYWDFENIKDILDSKILTLLDPQRLSHSA